MSQKGINTFIGWAEQLSFLTGELVSKQAIYKRINESTIVFLKTLLREKLESKLKKHIIKGLFSFFVNVYLQDSTLLHLPDELVQYFPGNYSKGKQKALAKIQTTYNLTQGSFKHFELASFTDNDQKASVDILEHLEENDLVIRDLGYFVLPVLKKIKNKGAYFLSRLKYDVSLFDANTGNEIDLMKLLKNKDTLDIHVLIGKKEKVEARMVVVRLPEAIANERRRKAKNDRDKRVNHSKEYYYLLGYGFYITNVECAIWDERQVVKAYGARWQIEIIFKCWKSNFSIEKIIYKSSCNKTRIEAIIYLMLLFIYLFQAKIYLFFKNIIYEKNRQHVSLLKLGKYIFKNFERIIFFKDLKLLENFILKYCCYEKRSDRANMVQVLGNFKSP